MCKEQLNVNMTDSIPRCPLYSVLIDFLKLGCNKDNKMKISKYCTSFNLNEKSCSVEFLISSALLLLALLSISTNKVCIK